MSNYVEQMWETNKYAVPSSRATRIIAWSVGIAAVLGFIAYSTQTYWYPYLSPYLYG